MLVQTTFEYKQRIPHITKMRVFVVDNNTVGSDISDDLDIFCHLYLTKLVTDELDLL